MPTFQRRRSLSRRAGRSLAVPLRLAWISLAAWYKNQTLLRLNVAEYFTIKAFTVSAHADQSQFIGLFDSSTQPVGWIASCSGSGVAEANQTQITTDHVIDARYIAGVDRALLASPTVRDRPSRGRKSSAPHLRSHFSLLIGPGELAEDFVGPLMASLASPIVYLDAVVPAFPSTVVGTLIVRNVERLVAAHQEQFLQWLDAQIEIARVITTSPRSLFPRVQRGTFSERLYYRLNTVIVELNSSMTT